MANKRTRREMIARLVERRLDLERPTTEEIDLHDELQRRGQQLGALTIARRRGLTER